MTSRRNAAAPAAALISDLSKGKRRGALAFMVRAALALLVVLAIAGCAADKRFKLKAPRNIPKWADQSPPGF